MSLSLTKLHNDSKGFAHLILILAIAGMVGVGGLTFWRISSYNNNEDASGRQTVAPDGTSSNSATVSDDCVAQTGDENICRLGAISDLSQYSSVVTMKMNGTTSVIKYDGKGNSEVTLGGDPAGITIGSRNYIYVMDAWYDAGGDDTQVPKTSVPSFGFATTAGIKYENKGKEACGNDTCFRYHMSGGLLREGVVNALIGDKDYLPRLIDSKGGLLGDLTMSVVYKPITITAPAGAQPISSLMPSGQ